MELLPEEIRKNSFIFRFVKRGERAIMYEQYDPEFDSTIAWEVFKRKIDKPKIVFGIQLNEREIFPGNEDFGKWAWSIRNLEKANTIFNDIEENKLDSEL